MDDYNEGGLQSRSMDETLEDWVMSKCNTWRDHYESNYSEKHDEYYRLWRGIWAKQDVTRASERSQIISPALQQAVESSVAEVEEATFGRGTFFNVTDDMDDPEKEDVADMRRRLHQDFGRMKVRKSVAEVLINSAVYGTGIAEVIIQEIKEMKPATQPIMEGQMSAIGVNITDRTVVSLQPVLPKHFLIDPLATSVDDALGCAVDRFVAKHSIEALQEAGVYRDVYIGTAAADSDLEVDPEEIGTILSDDKVRLTKYFGLVPRHLLKKAEELKYSDDDEAVKEVNGLAGELDYSDEDTENEDTDYYVEAIVIIANEDTCLKAEANPFMMQDRPIVAFAWDVVPSRFWGRGICEKGYNSQKALDAEIRARIDALGLTVHPMMAMDATRIPRGSKPEIRPGKLLLTNGNPAEILHPFNFGQVSQITFAQADALQRMVQTSTGAVDSTGPSVGQGGGDTAAGISMSLGSIIKRHKRTLINFQESFLIPFVEKAAYRYMQFDPEHYRSQDYKFNTTSSLGIMAREYEVTQLVQLLQTMPAESPLYPSLVKSIVENMNLSNREELLKTLETAGQPTPEQQQAQQQAQQQQAEFQASQTAALNGQAKESEARAEKLKVEAQLMPAELEVSKMKAVTTNLNAGNADDREFEKRLKIADLKLREDADRRKNEREDRKEARESKPNVAEDALMAQLSSVNA